MVLGENPVLKADETPRNMGNKLEDRIIRVLTPAQLNGVHVVMPIPETSNTSAPCIWESAREAVLKRVRWPREI